jgi:MYXO-CTERM domain-containing protein
VKTALGKRQKGDSMKRTAAICFFMACVAAGPARAATYDLSGDWDLAFTAVSHTGPCPAGVNFTGTVTIEQTGDDFTYSITSGTPCDPAFTCVFAGTVADDVYTGSNSGDVPEGGTVTNTMTFTADSAAHAEGSSTSTWQEAEVVCTWESTFVLSREMPGEEGAPEPAAEEEGLEPVPDGISDPVPDGTSDPLPDVSPDTAPDAAADTATDGPDDGGEDGGCGCVAAAVDPAPAGWALVLLLAGALVLRPRKRRP